jgi:hypothetical protein
MNIKEAIEYMVDEANAFNAGADWGFSSFANLIIEVVARYTKKYYNIDYIVNNRIYSNMALHNLLDKVREEVLMYREQHEKTCAILEYLASKLEETEDDNQER